MSHLEKEIKEEKEGAAHYRKLAKHAEGEHEEEVLEDIAEDESRHARELGEIEKHESGMMAPVDVPKKFKNIIKR